MSMTEGVNGVFLGLCGDSKEIVILDPKEEIQLSKSGVGSNMYIGVLGSGRASHPWGNLNKCICGGTAFMVGKNGVVFEEGYPYSIKCLECSRHTIEGDVLFVKEDWNNQVNIQS